jgi:hypothetical protein
MFVMAAVTGMSFIPSINRLWSRDWRGTDGMMIGVFVNVVCRGVVAH